MPDLSQRSTETVKATPPHRLNSGSRIAHQSRLCPAYWAWGRAALYPARRRERPLNPTPIRRDDGDGIRPSGGTASGRFKSVDARAESRYH